MEYFFRGLVIARLPSLEEHAKRRRNSAIAALNQVKRLSDCQLWFPVHPTGGSHVSLFTNGASITFAFMMLFSVGNQLRRERNTFYFMKLAPKSAPLIRLIPAD